MSNQSSTSNDKQFTIQDIIHEIEEKSADGDYIFRGERQLNKKVSSTLYRDFDDIDMRGFDIEVVQKEMLNGAKKHTGHLPHTGDIPPDFRPILARMFSVREEDTAEVDFEILTEIQHYGGKTNLIDFTTDYLVALFFACDGHHDKDGRIILQKTDQIKEMLRYPRNPRHRVAGQKSVFVRSPKGYIEPNKDNMVTIPKSLKKLILQYLRKYHGISTETIYNDLYGFIRSQDIHASANTQIYKGLACKNRGDKTEIQEEKQKEYEEAIKHYTKAIELKPDSAEAYYHRGVVYFYLDNFDSAIMNFAEMIKLEPNEDNAYLWRGLAYKHEGNFDEAIEDHNKAIALKLDNPHAYFNLGVIYKEKEDFDLAIENFTKAIELDLNFAGAYNHRGLVFRDKQNNYECAIEDFTKVIGMNPDNVDEIYNNRGIAYRKKGDYERALGDHTKAIELKTDSDQVYYYNRSIVWLFLKEWERAKEDLITARDKQEDINRIEFRKDYESVSDFEQKHNVKLPEDIAAMLTPL